VANFLSKRFSYMQVWNCVVKNSLHEPKESTDMQEKEDNRTIN